MTRYNYPVACLLLLTVFCGMLFTATPAYASSLDSLLGQTDTAESGGHGIWNILLGLLLGNVLSKVTNLSSDITDKLGLPASIFSSGVSKPGSKDILGFYAEWWDADTASYKDMSQHVDVLKKIAPLWATLHADGTLSDKGGNDHASVVKFAHQNNLPVLLLVNNATSKGSGSPIDTILSDPSLRAKSIDSLEAYIKKYNLDGVNIDFEMVPAGDRDNLTAFMRELSARLRPQGYTVSMDVFPKQDETNDVSVAYDYGALAQYVDKIMLMTYDCHGTWSDAGPIADINWVEKCLKYALQFIPKEKIYLGIAGYGYDWSRKGVESLEYKPIMDLAQRFDAHVQFDDQSKSPYFNYTGSDGVDHQVWFENSQSLQYKVNLVNKYDIAGVALWKLGDEDPADWQVLKNNL